MNNYTAPYPRIAAGPDGASGKLGSSIGRNTTSAKSRLLPAEAAAESLPDRMAALVTEFNSTSAPEAPSGEYDLGAITQYRCQRPAPRHKESRRPTGAVVTESGKIAESRLRNNP